MKIEVILPYLFYNDQQISDMSNGSIFLNAGNLEELHKEILEKYPQLVQKIWDDKGEIHKNIMLIVNNNFINKNEYPLLSFPQNSVVEIMTQFAGG